MDNRIRFLVQSCMSLATAVQDLQTKRYEALRELEEECRKQLASTLEYDDDCAVFRCGDVEVTWRSGHGNFSFRIVRDVSSLLAKAEAEREVEEVKS
jgi:uncharacterized protein YijF (DUF1287 family)